MTLLYTKNGTLLEIIYIKFSKLFFTISVKPNWVNS